MTTTNPVTITAPEGLPYVETAREFEAPAALVYRAHEDPELFARWCGPHGLEMSIDVYDLRTGGRYRYVHRDADGNEYAFRGVVHEAVPGARIVQTFEFEGAPGQVSLEAMTLEDLPGGRSRITGRATFQSVEARDAILEHGMETGLREGFERLDALLADG
jgi:uncharacterized protein YndB with AHSA1/START domain